MMADPYAGLGIPCGNCEVAVPRKPDVLPDDTAAWLARARYDRDAAVDEANREFRAAVLAALTHGSVRQVAAAAGLSPTTVMQWKGEAQ